jgi:hypothetical protein
MIEDLESIINKALTYMERACQDVDEAVAKGKKVVQVGCAPGTRRGDIIEITPIVPQEGEPDTMKARVIAVNPSTTLSGESLHRVFEALCVVIEPGELTTEEEFAALYTEEASEDPEAEEAEEAEEVDPDVCSCGADKIMCERNQNVFGGHLNEES